MRSPSIITHALCGSPVVEGCAAITDRCWLCGAISARGMRVTDWVGANFTDWDRVALPSSDTICEACVYVCSWTDPPGRRSKREDAKRGTMFRMYSHVWERGWSGKQASQYANADKGEKPLLRAFIEREHAGDWFAAIADSGKKHVLPFAPMNAPGRGGLALFDDLLVSVPSETRLIGVMVSLLTAGPSKAEIETGQYSQQNWARCMSEIRAFEETHGRERGGAWFSLALWLAQRDEEQVAARVAAEKETKGAERARKGTSKNAGRGAASGRAKRIPEEQRGERAEALDATRGSPEGGDPDDGERGGVGVSNRPPDASRAAQQGRLPGIG